MEYKSKYTGEQIDALLDLAGEGGGASGNEVFNCQYIDISGKSNKLGWEMVSILAKISAQGMTFIAPPSYNPFGTQALQAVAVDFNTLVYGIAEGQKIQVTIREVLNQNGITNEEIDSTPRISKEEFYTL